MHTLTMLAAGFVLLAAILGAARAFLAPSAERPAALAFIPLWFAVAVVNLLVGVYRAGYSFVAEAGVLVVVFGLPAAAAWLWSRRGG